VAPHVQNFSDLVQGKHFQIWGSMEESGEMFFSTENWPYLKSGKRQSQGSY